MNRIVIIDDEVNMGKVLSKLLGLEGYEVQAFSSAPRALEYLSGQGASLVLTDLRMPEMGGEEVLESVQKVAPGVPVIVMTAYGTVESAMKCVRKGAHDYITKPFDTRVLVQTVREALEASPKFPAPPTPPDAMRPDKLEARILGTSQLVESVRSLIRKVAPNDSAILISGESGTGKELVARAIHDQSPRQGGRFMAINCASIPESLVESELFGHEKGAFTGAQERRTGLIESASRGTLFLDEIGELPLAMQAKLLRTLQEREITRVGSVEPIPVDIRVIAATNRHLEKEVQVGNFREDLYYRLHVVKIKLPPLRERPEDVPLLARYFLDHFKIQFARPALAMSDSFIGRLVQMKWPGNVRELRNFIERVTVLTEVDLITDEIFAELAVYESHLPPELPQNPSQPLPVLSLNQMMEYRKARDEFEAAYLKAMLASAGGNVTDAARHAGISRRSFYEKLEKLGIDTSNYK